MGNLIRNTGFEAGNTNFWTVSSGDTFAADTGDKKYGTYSGKLTSVGTGTIVLETDDYIPVNLNGIYNLSFWFIGAAVKALSVRVEMYDKDLSYIDKEIVISKDCTIAWALYEAQFICPVEVEYVKIEFRITAPLDTMCFWIDNAVFESCISEGSIIRIERLANILSVVASGDTFDDRMDIQEFEHYYADLRCTSLTGSTPLLDIDVVERTEAGADIVVGSFAQLNGAGSERIKLTNATGRTMYVKYTEGGTWTDCDFTVDIIGKR